MTEKRTVLVVDDEPTNIQLIRELLKDTYKIKVATNGEMALKIASSDHPPDLILLDIMMPVVDGYEACRRLKSENTTQDIPVIFLTAKTEMEDEKKGLELGGVDYITKPISPPILKARVKVHLDLKSARERLQEQNRILMENVSLREEVERITRHDMKNPLQYIMGGIQLLMSENLSPDQKEIIQIMKTGAFRILDMINSSLELYKMETGRYQLNPVSVDLQKVIKEIGEGIRDELKSKKLTLEVYIDGKKTIDSTPFMVEGEEMLIYSMLANLIRNALEASPMGEHVKILLESGNPSTIRIHNKGAIPEQIRNRLFEKYTTFGKEKGIGLGNYSAKLMAQTLGGDIRFETSDELGTTFIITLPVKKK